MVNRHEFMSKVNFVGRIFSTYSEELLVAVWFGLLAGLLEGITTVILRALPGVIIRASPEILWIAPVFNLLLFVLMGIGLALLLIRVFGKRARIRVMVGFFCWVILFAAFLMIGKLHQVASLLLGLGLAFETSRRLKGRERYLLLFFRRTVGILIVLALLVGITGVLWDELVERYEVSQLPQSKPEMPNLIIITLDTLRADHLSAYGYERDTTPNLDRLAEDGVLFENAFANSSWTLPAHASLFTGRLPHEHRANWQTPLDENYPTLAEVLTRQGYLTAAFSANTSFVAPEWGLGRGFTRFEVYGSSLADAATRTLYGKKLALNILPRLGYYDIPGRKRAGQLNREFLQWLDGVEGRPFFAFLNYFDVHDPYLTLVPYQTRFSSQVTRGDLINFQFQIRFRRKSELTPQEIQMEINSYDGTLAYLDAELGNLFSELTQRGLIENTLIIITSDHGESLGNHDLFGHGNSLYIETLHVPLIFYWPGQIPAGEQVSNLVSLHQIPSTTIELLGQAASSPFPGESLVRYWSQNPSDEPDVETGQREWVLAELSPGRFEGVPTYPTAGGEMQSLITDQWHFILSESDQIELYNWREDRQEAHNLARSPAGQVLVQEFTQQLNEMLELADPAAVRNDK